MHRLVAPLLSLILALPAAAEPDLAGLEFLREGSMRKLVLHEVPVEVGSATFTDLEDRTHALSDYRGKIVVLNFWATWCAPCRKEMPALDRLHVGMRDNDVEVLAVATGRNSPAALARFFDETGVENLTIYRDPSQAMAREMAVLGLPVTVILDREGREVARLQGEAEWDGESARAILAALAAGGSRSRPSHSPGAWRP
jgi:thiol-disulfide isomerase/thioredoxin